MHRWTIHLDCASYYLRRTSRSVVHKNRQWNVGRQPSRLDRIWFLIVARAGDHHILAFASGNELAGDRDRLRKESATIVTQIQNDTGRMLIQCGLDGFVQLIMGIVAEI